MTHGVYETRRDGETKVLRLPTSRQWMEAVVVYCLIPASLGIDWLLAGPISFMAPYGVWIFAILAIATHAVSSRVQERPHLCSIAVGMLLSFALGSLFIGIALLPFVGINILFGINFSFAACYVVPFAAAFSFFARMRALQNRAPRSPWRFALMALGLLLPPSSSYLTNWLHWEALHWNRQIFETRIDRATTAEEIERAISSLGHPLICVGGHCRHTLCNFLDGPSGAAWLTSDRVRDAAVKLLRGDPKRKCLKPLRLGESTRP